MARTKDAAVTEIRKVRRRLSLEMAKALEEGRLDQYMRRMEREVDGWLRNGAKDGRRRKTRNRAIRKR